MDWQGRRVLITGGRGFLGQHIVHELWSRGADPIPVGRSEADLRDRDATIRLFDDIRPDAVVHAAVEGGGIGWMKDHPVESGQDNARMNLNALEGAARHAVEVFIGISSACVYPRMCPVPFTEAAIWDGYPEPINGSYALSKRLMMDMGRAYAEQHGLHCVFPILANLYGPGDHTSPERAHVVADLMIRCAQGPSELVVWGTGTPTREFLYVTDAAAGVLACAEGPPGPINIGSGQEVAIRDLAAAVLAAWDLNAPVRLDRDRPDGQPRKCLSVSRAAELLGWRAPTELATGLRLTAAWYREQLS